MRGLCGDASVATLRDLVRSQKPTVVHIQETFLKERNKIAVPGYKVLRLDRETHGGGLLTLVKKDVIINSVRSASTTAFEALEVILCLDDRSQLRLINIYVPRDSRGLKTNLRLLLGDGRTVLAGDLNAKHFSWSDGINNAGRKIDELLPRNGFRIAASEEDTYVAPDGQYSSKIDFFIHNLPHDLRVEIVDEFQSDHRPIQAELDLIYDPQEPKKSFVFKEADWTVYQNSIRDSIDRWAIDDDATGEQIDDAIDWCVEEMISARNAAVPTKIARPPKDFVRSQVTNDLLALKRQLNKKLLEGGLTPVEHAETRSELKETNRLLGKNFAVDRNSNWAKFLAKANVSAEDFWKKVKMAKNLGDRRTTHLTDEAGETSHDPNEMVEMLADQFALAHAAPTTPPNQFDIAREQEAEVIRNNAERMECAAITADTVAMAIARIKKNKAPGLDQVNGHMLKNLPRAAIAQIASIFNHCLVIGHWPLPFKLAVVVALPKKGKAATSTKGYRPISLLPVLGKIFERIVADRITSHADIREIIPRQQFGFKAGHAADMQCTNMAAVLTRNKMQKKNSAVLAFDVSNAFPSVWPAGLTSKMASRAFPPYLVRIIAKFLEDRTIMVRAFGRLSTPRQIDIGVPQGSCISPILFNIYTADIPTRAHVDILQFADDTAVIAASRVKEAPIRRIAKYGEALATYCRRWHLRLCPEKTQFLYVPHIVHRKRLPATKPSIDGVEIERSDAIRYLGVLFDWRLKFDQHVNWLKSKVAAKMSSLFALVLGPTLSRPNRLKIVRQILWPATMYGAAAWGYAPNTAKVALRRRFSMAAKTVLRLPRTTSSNYLYEILKLPRLEVAAAAARGDLIARLQNSQYEMEPLLANIYMATPPD